MKNTIRKGLMIAGATLVVAGSAPAFATASDVAVKVEYAPVELTYSFGRERVYGELKSAARKICGETTYGAVHSLETVQANKSCYEETLSNAVSKIGNDALTAMHRGDS